MRTQKGKTLLVALGMCCIMALGMTVKASEEVSNSYDEEIMPQYVNLGRVTANLSISNGTATCSGRLNMQTNKSCSITMTLQKKSGSSWKNVITWTGTDTKSFSLTKTYSVSQGVSYRVKVTGTCGSESSTQYSATKSY